MITNYRILSSQTLQIEKFFSYIGIEGMVCDIHTQLDGVIYWYFHREETSTTLFALRFEAPAFYELSLDHLASYKDYQLFPYLIDSLRTFLNGELADFPKGTNVYQLLDEEWIEETIADEIAFLKGTLTLASQYYLAQPLDDMTFITLNSLYPYGVNLHSSTPRIYGYIQFLLRHHLLPHDAACETDYLNVETKDAVMEETEVEVDIPQHIPIGRVKSWQLDGSETYETYSQEDVDHLLVLAESHLQGRKLSGVVLNDIGTLHQEGIGIETDGEKAIYWFEEAYKAGDNLYAPTNLGDLYRKGCGNIAPDPKKAFHAYTLSADPYAHYRIGQAYEEGVTGKIDMNLAMKWYKQAAEEGHHLAIKRLKSIH